MLTPPAAKAASFMMSLCSGMFVLTPSTTISCNAVRMRASADRETLSAMVRDVTDQYELRRAQSERVKELTALFQVQRAALEGSSAKWKK